MRYDRRQPRGSVLVMVIGLLTLLALLGGTFLLVARLDARQADALAATAPRDPVVEGIVRQLIDRIGADLYIDGPDGAYTAADWGGPMAWRTYIDVPLQPPAQSDLFQNADTILADPWLSAHLQDEDPPYRWPRVTQLTEAVWEIPVGGLTVNDVDPDRDYMVDTDGDGVNDAILYPTGVTNAKGDRYYAAVRVVDLGGLLNVNTAGDPEDMDLDAANIPTGQAHVDLRRLLRDLGADNYASVHSSRASGPDPPDLPDYLTECAQRLLQPFRGTHDYMPFGIADEMFFRRLEPRARNPVGTARLGTLLQSLSQDDRRLLTTFNASRNALRRPASGAAAPLVIDDFFFEQLAPGFSAQRRQDVYDHMLAMLKELEIGDDDEQREKFAAHFVANLWAYVHTGGDPDDRQYADASVTGWPWPFTPAGVNDWRVYGLTNDLVIVEGYAAHIAPTEDPADPGEYLNDWAWAYAIEIYNPTDDSVNLDDYVLKLDTGSGDPEDLPNYTLGSGDRVVLYDYEFGEDYVGGSQPEDLGLPSDPDAEPDWIEVEGIDFSDDGFVRLLRKWGNQYIPIDEISARDIDEYSLDNKEEAAEDGWSNAQRDDNLDRARYNITVYEQDSGGDPADADEPGGHTLGDENAVDENDLTDDARYPVAIIGSGAGLLRDVGELSRIYLTGPLDNDGVWGDDYGELRPFSRNLTESDFTDWFPDTPARGRLDLHPDEVPDGGWGESMPIGRRYPDVPAGAFLAEFFTVIPPDPSRTLPGNRTHLGRDGTRRVYGRVNVNTAPAEVLERLPWPESCEFGGQTYQMTEFEIRRAVDYILAYRDRRAVTLDDSGIDYSTRSIAFGSLSIDRLREKSEFDGFLSPGEVAIPLADYFTYRMGYEEGYPSSPNGNPFRHPGWQIARDSLYTAVGNLLTVNSDVYAATIRVSLYPEWANEQDNIYVDTSDPDYVPPLYSWHYVAVIDRSNCVEEGDRPALLLFAPVR